MKKHHSLSPLPIRWRKHYWQLQYCTRRGGRGIELTHTPLFSIFAFLLQTLQLAVATLSYTAATIWSDFFCMGGSNCWQPCSLRSLFLLNVCEIAWNRRQSHSHRAVCGVWWTWWTYMLLHGNSAKRTCSIRCSKMEENGRKWKKMEVGCACRHGLECHSHTHKSWHPWSLWFYEKNAKMKSPSWPQNLQ